MPTLDLSPQNITLALAWFVVFIFSTCLHEAGHAWSALWLGDPTAHHGGQTTLNPLPHIRREPVGMVVIPLISFFLNGFMIGWASAPYDPRWATVNPRRAALMALSGPAGNLILLIVSGILLRLGLQFGYFHLNPAFFNSGARLDQLVLGAHQGVPTALALVLSIFFMLNLILVTLNLVPLPPFDGSSAIPLILPDKLISPYLQMIHQPGLWLLGLIVAFQGFGHIFRPVAFGAMSLLFAGL